MATELVISTDGVRKFFDDLEAQKTILSSCTQLFTTLSNRFASLKDSLSLKSQSLESKIQALESTSRETLESLSHREDSIMERESAAAARVEEQREAALAEFDKTVSGTAELSETLKSLSRKMDSSGLLRFIVSKRKESVSLRAEISKAIAEAVDPPTLVLDAMEEFLGKKSADRRWACGMLVQALFPDSFWKGKKNNGPEFSSSVVERVAGILELWKGQMDEEGGALGAAEAVMLLQMIVGFGLRSTFDEEYLKKLVVEFAARRDMAKLAAALGFGEKLGEIIDELVKSGKEIEAVYFAYEAGLTERFPPVSLIKLHLKNSKKNASTILKNGNNSMAATEESSTLELNSIRAIIKCVEDHKLESEFSLDSLRKRVTHLEKAKAERKKSSSAAGKPQNKRAYGASGGRGSGPPSFRPSKAAKFSNTYPSSFSRRNPAPPAQSPTARYTGPYNYPSHSVYEGPSATPYASSYGVPHSQSPAIPRQHYSLPVDGISAAGYRAGGSYGAQTSYCGYDYGNAAPPSYQPSSYTQ
ncbi:hypothetical protein I3842_03G221600 [Carya illinoinensis]|uniref:FRIGIDA-like protein n=1 Tax=Carya illinoinensis TaxID=32201 RepID=A0A922FPC2_CARIL|nr:hypothetical protein I3842_03G221600 [Carya illinoinensis]